MHLEGGYSGRIFDQIRVLSNLPKGKWNPNQPTYKSDMLLSLAWMFHGDKVLLESWDCWISISLLSEERSKNVLAIELGLCYRFGITASY